jgi:cytidylate kinase
VKVTIDGPAGAGKSTVARMLARRLGCSYIDTGAMYRAVTLKALRAGINLHDEAALTKLAESINVELIVGAKEITYVLLDGEDVSSEIRSPRVSQNVSLVACIAGVRRELARRQRKMAKDGGVVMEGRDAGTVILPEAQFKFFLTASEKERARRRRADLKAAGVEVELARLTKEIKERDRLDSSREFAPLQPAPGAQIVDSSRLRAEEVVELILNQIKRKKG